MFPAMNSRLLSVALITLITSSFIVIDLLSNLSPPATAATTVIARPRKRKRPTLPPRTPPESPSTNVGSR
jgi:hypothetical protein